MHALVEDFFKALRGSDLDVSLNAQVDASRALELVGWSDHHVVKAALGTTLAKSQHDRALFDEVFDRFFSTEALTGALETTQASRAEEQSDAQVDASGTLLGGAGVSDGAGSGGGGGAGGGSSGGQGGQSDQTLSQLLLSGDAVALVRRMQQAARHVGLTDIWFFTQKGQYTQRILQDMGLRALEREITEARRLDADSELADRLEEARKKLLAEVRHYVERKLALYGTTQMRELREEFMVEKRLDRISPRDHELMSQVVRKIAKRLAARHSRRQKRRVRGQLDFRKTLRRNVAYDGVMFDLVWRTKVIDKPRVVAICDVSGSVRQYAGFLLLFLHSLSEHLADLRSFAFTYQLVEVTETFNQHRVEVAVDKVMKTIGGGGTDYGQVMLDIQDQLMDDMDQKTTVIILGDARNNNGQAHSEIMEQLHQRAGRIIWLNPESMSSWGVGDSVMKNYAPYCHMARECNTIAHLERTLDALLRHA